VGSPHIQFRTFSEQRITDGLRSKAISQTSVKKRLKAQLKHVYGEWGEIYLDTISRGAVSRWNATLCEIARGERLVDGKRYAPEYVRGWWTAFLAVMRAATMHLGIKADVYEKLPKIPKGAAPGRADKGPNTLSIGDELPRFMASAWKLSPRWFLRFATEILTSRRPCEIRPLRPGADIDLEAAMLHVVRSEVDGEIRNTTKTGTEVDPHHFHIGLPPVMVALFRAHMADGELAFPGTLGTYESEYEVRKAIAAICADAGITTRLTPYFARRVFHDLARRVGADDRTVGSMGGHPINKIAGLTKETQNAIYASVGADEQRALIEKMAQLGRIFEATGLAARGVGAAHVGASGDNARASEEAA
jgi:hypothetical protein